MKSSLKLGVIRGIKVKVHWTFFLLIAWIALMGISSGGDLSSILWNIGFILVLFACVVMHELGHSLTAKKFGISTRQITLLPIGGVASLESMPEDPGEEFLVAIAGPAVNVLIAVLLYIITPVENFLNQEPGALEQMLSTINAGNFLFFLFSANVMLVLFNLLPAFPMDGGRVLRALLSMKMGRVRATHLAARLGQLVAFLFFFIGLFYNPILILIAIFVYFGAHTENVMVQQLTLLKDHKVRDAMMTDITLLNPEDSINDVVDIILSGAERDFVVTDNGNVKGVVYQSDLISLYKNRQTDIKVKDVMDEQFYKVDADENLTDVYQKVQANNKTFFPVVKQDSLVGAIDMSNISEFMIFRASLDY